MHPLGWATCLTHLSFILNMAELYGHWFDSYESDNITVRSLYWNDFRIQSLKRENDLQSALCTQWILKSPNKKKASSSCVKFWFPQAIYKDYSQLVLQAFIDKKFSACVKMLVDVRNLQKLHEILSPFHFFFRSLLFYFIPIKKIFKSLLHMQFTSHL